MKKIQLLGKISGTRNETPWPPHLSVIELPEGEAVDLIKSGQARETDEKVTDADFGRAVFTPPETAEAPNASTGGPDKTTQKALKAVSYTHLRAHETDSYLVCRLLLE